MRLSCTSHSAALQEFDYVFSENGLVAYKAGQLLAVQSLAGHLGEAKLKEFINFCLHYIAGGRRELSSLRAGKAA